MWSSLQNIIKQFPKERFIIIEDGAPRYVVLSVEAYQELLEGEKQKESVVSSSSIETSKHEQAVPRHDAEQINSALQEVAAEAQNVQQEVSVHEEHAPEQVFVPERPHGFHSVAVNIDDLPL